MRAAAATTTMSSSTMLRRNRGIWTLSDITDASETGRPLTSVHIDNNNNEKNNNMSSSPNNISSSSSSSSASTADKSSSLQRYHIPILHDDIRSKEMLDRVVREFEPIVHRRGYNVLSVSELCCCNDGLDFEHEFDKTKRKRNRKIRRVGNSVWGYNRWTTSSYHGKSHTIHLRLRHPTNHKRFLLYEDVAGTMAHELAHCEHGPHNDKFYKLMDEILEEHAVLMASKLTNHGGYTMPAFSGQGQTLGAGNTTNSINGAGAGAGRRSVGGGNANPSSDHRTLAAAAATRRQQQNTALDVGGCKLGGEDAFQHFMTPSEAAAVAAEARRRQTQLRLRGDHCCRPCTEIEDDEDEDEVEVVDVIPTPRSNYSNTSNASSTSSRNNGGRRNNKSPRHLPVDDDNKSSSTYHHHAYHVDDRKPPANESGVNNNNNNKKRSNGMATETTTNATTAVNAAATAAPVVASFSIASIGSDSENRGPLSPAKKHKEEDTRSPTLPSDTTCIDLTNEADCWSPTSTNNNTNNVLSPTNHNNNIDRRRIHSSYNNHNHNDNTKKWSCIRCTFLNFEMALACSLCKAERNWKDVTAANDCAAAAATVRGDAAKRGSAASSGVLNGEILNNNSYDVNSSLDKKTTTTTTHFFRFDDTDITDGGVGGGQTTTIAAPMSSSAEDEKLIGLDYINKWSCSRCTYLNRNESMLCGLCSAERRS